MIFAYYVGPHSDFLCSERYVDFCLRSALKRCEGRSFAAEGSAGVCTVLVTRLASLVCRVSEARSLCRRQWQRDSTTCSWL